jgi:hypothetical protein
LSVGVPADRRFLADNGGVAHLIAATVDASTKVPERIISSTVWSRRSCAERLRKAADSLTQVGPDHKRFLRRESPTTKPPCRTLRHRSPSAPGQTPGLQGLHSAGARFRLRQSHVLVPGCALGGLLLPHVHDTVRAGRVERKHDEAPFDCVVPRHTSEAPQSTEVAVHTERHSYIKDVLAARTWRQRT